MNTKKITAPSKKHHKLSTLALAIVASSGLGASSIAQESNTESDLNVSGQYIGYYADDVATNPEDPTTGVFNVYFNEETGEFTGKMNFTFYGCQRSSVGEVTGKKVDSDTMQGNWSGSVDGLSQTGPFIGTYDAEKDIYEGTFSVDKGKQRVVIDNCIRYYIAPKGNWKSFSLEGESDAEQKLDLIMSDDKSKRLTINNNTGKTALAYSLSYNCIWSDGDSDEMQFETLKQDFQMGGKRSVDVPDSVITECANKSSNAELVVTLTMRDDSYDVNFGHMRLQDIH